VQELFFSVPGHVTSRALVPTLRTLPAEKDDTQQYRHHVVKRHVNYRKHKISCLTIVLKVSVDDRGQRQDTYWANAAWTAD